MRITALSPIHVGDGSKIGKKEYVQQGLQKPIIIVDTVKMLKTLSSLRRDNAYADFMLYERKLGLGQWLKNQRIDQRQIDSWKRYTLDSGDAFVLKNTGENTATPKEILCFIKDAYEKPYVPGSTLKGMLRTAILCWRIHNDPSRYKDVLEKLRASADRGGKRNFYLKSETTELEAEVFNILERDDKKRGNVVNSMMSGFIVSDSLPISEEQLMLAQKIDYTLRGEEKALPILREALKPGTQIDFELTIDSRICNVTIDEVLKSLEYFQTVSYEHFYQHFGRGSNAKGTVWLGGGTGFLSKTILYPIYGKEAVEFTDQVFKVTLDKNYDIHKHRRDRQMGISPHVCKCTRYRGKLYDMGMGKIEVIH